MKLIAPSILSADFTKLADEIRSVEAAGADWIHVDVMDGHFVPNITMGPLIVKAVRQVTALPIDVHLMIENPECYIKNFVEAGASLISVHVEACLHLSRTIRLVKETGLQAGAVLNPSTPVDQLQWVLDDVDFVLIMSVNPGFEGQSFIPKTVEKIRNMRQMIDAMKLTTLIEVDGGINDSTISEVAGAGADVFVAGSAIFGSRDYGRTIQRLRKSIHDTELK
ncbi:MAG: ribulose-phosphate 3-epimerase [Deltaproteobacteria bacterium]|nr:ribulose-phosphate 3-epimerase [Deltaproteobacteria bacterium]MBW1962628.1 ribulose-phosphate 3-epimerase [Deltaproteobacteria bacterium]MBW1994176.1 ribulose-phosphate 3-epimerase [Deltaproteobacteria bacterium]MBW2151912.1 ribulose-phosphate 3-epimerase [Deltaproteobacteria bacterium]